MWCVVCYRLAPWYPTQLFSVELQHWIRIIVNPTHVITRVNVSISNNKSFAEHSIQYVLYADVHQWLITCRPSAGTEYWRKCVGGREVLQKVDVQLDLTLNSISGFEANDLQERDCVRLLLLFLPSEKLLGGGVNESNSSGTQRFQNVPWSGPASRRRRKRTRRMEGVRCVFVRTTISISISMDLRVPSLTWIKTESRFRTHENEQQHIWTCCMEGVHCVFIFQISISMDWGGVPPWHE